jgi:hypothetical protein
VPKCCSPARAKAKRIATRKARRMALKGITPKKAKPKKGKAKTAKAKKAEPCRLCGRKK